MKIKFFIFLAIVFFFLSTLAVKAGDGTTLGDNFISFGSSGSGSGEFSYPRGVYVDTANNKLYVADFSNRRITMMDSGEGGTILGANFISFGSSGSGSGQFSSPRGIFVDTAHNKVYVVDGSANNRVAMMDSGSGGTTLGENFVTFGSFGSGDNHFNTPIGIFIDTTRNRLYVGDYYNHRIAVMDSGSGGTTLGANFTSFGANGFGSGQFNGPEGVFVNVATNKLFVADVLNNRIVMMDSGSGGTTLGANFTTFGLIGSGSGQFNNPINVFVDTTTNKLYVTDNNNNRIDMMDSGEGGTTLGDNFTSFGTIGTGTGEFNTIWGLFVDTDSNRIYVSEYNTHRIDVMDSYSPATSDSDDSEISENSSVERAKITSWSAYKYIEERGDCRNKLKLTIKGKHFDDDVKVYVGTREASSVDRKSSKKLVAKYCLDKLLESKADHKKNIYVKNPDTDERKAEKQIDLENILPEFSTNYFSMQSIEGIKNIQTILVKLGYMDAQYITGFYGSITTEAVKKFQVDNGIESTGFVGPLTKAKLEEKAK